MTISNFQCVMAYDDLREWIREADRLGELRTVKGASWKGDIGQASDLVIREDDDRRRARGIRSTSCEGTAR